VKPPVSVGRFAEWSNRIACPSDKSLGYFHLVRFADESQSLSFCKPSLE